MKFQLIKIISIITLLSSCEPFSKEKKNIKFNIHTINKDSTKNINKIEESLIIIPENLKPIVGYRFIISGDFDGDGKKEKLLEHFFSGIENKETNKFYDSLVDYSQLVYLTLKKKPISFVSCDNKEIDTLQISVGGQHLGLSYLKNEGDLNGDGTDEVSFVINWADWSNLNTWNLVTYKNNKWSILYSFPIWDWQLPNLPNTINQYGLLGLNNKIINDTFNKQQENELMEFEGLIKKIKENTIQVICRNDEAEIDTLIITLK